MLVGAVRADVRVRAFGVVAGASSVRPAAAVVIVVVEEDGRLGSGCFPCGFGDFCVELFGAASAEGGGDDHDEDDEADHTHGGERPSDGAGVLEKWFATL